MGLLRNELKNKASDLEINMNRAIKRPAGKRSELDLIGRHGRFDEHGHEDTAQAVISSLHGVVQS